VFSAKTSEPAHFDAMPGGKRLGHRIENRVNGVVGVLRSQMRITFRHTSDQFRLGHVVVSTAVRPPPLATRKARDSVHRESVLAIVKLGFQQRPRFVVPLAALLSAVIFAIASLV